MYLAVLLLAIVPAPTLVVEDRVDLIEVNHCYDDFGRLVFEQAIFYDWSEEDHRYQVVDWTMLKRLRQFPVSDRGQAVMTWQGGLALRRVVADQYRETWTQFDPELYERKILPRRERRGLTKLQ